MKLNKQVALVTGAGQGIGRQIALKLAGEGAFVVANDLDEEQLTTTCQRIAGAGGLVKPLVGSVTDEDFGDKAVAFAVEAFGDLHIIVNNAGYIWNSSITNHTDDQWAAMVDVHLTAPFRLLRAAGAYFRAEAKKLAGRSLPSRRVVNISSVSGVYGSPTQVSYAAAKAGVVGMTKTLAKEWGRYNVNVNAVAFGHIDTRLTMPFKDEVPEIEVAGRKHKVGLSEEQLTMMKASTPLGRHGTVEDAAGAVFLLCSPEASYITGQVLICDGGLGG